MFQNLLQQVIRGQNDPTRPIHYTKACHLLTVKVLITFELYYDTTTRYSETLEILKKALKTGTTHEQKHYQKI